MKMLSISIKAEAQKGKKDTTVSQVQVQTAGYNLAG